MIRTNNGCSAISATATVSATTGPPQDRKSRSDRLLDRLTGTNIPEPLISQFLPTLYPRVASGTLDPVPRTLVLEAVRDVLRTYASACRTTGAANPLSWRTARDEHPTRARCHLRTTRQVPPDSYRRCNEQ